ncbi:MAG: UDP-N-acetylmuramate--L-alanine ligase [Planctomycetaceae bacterium]|nr:UDP-N-acetylmuramate--L-alanine ligase [Planctomycetaceae bacterium]
MSDVGTLEMYPSMPTDTTRPSRNLPQIRRTRIRSAHLVGVGGSGMQALAQLMHGFRCRITGSDQGIPQHLFWRLHQQGLRVNQGHDAANLPETTDVLIHSPTIPGDNPERVEAARCQLPQLSLSQAIGRLMANRIGVSVAGTHGKTSTTSLLGHLLDTAGLSPSVLAGAEIRGRGVSGWAGRSKLFVAESCEYQDHFLDLTPKHAILLNIEPDHFDCFPTLESSIKSFGRFAGLLPDDGTLIVNADCQAAMQAAQQTQANIVTFGTRLGSDWWLSDMRQTSQGWRFRIFHQSMFFGEFDLPLPGRHQVLNALAAIAMSRTLGACRRDLSEGLRSFPGVVRRFDQIGSWKGVTLIDDYAHHPTAIRTTLKTARERFPKRRVWCAFQPHQISRTQNLLSDFARSLGVADEVLIAPIFAAREVATDDRFRLSREMVDRVNRTGTSARFVESLDEITTTIETEARPGDVFVTLGAGDIDRIAYEFTLRLQRHRAS